MNISLIGNTLIIEDICFDARLTLIDSAQVFHWRQLNESEYACVVNGRAVRLSEHASGFSLAPVSESDIAFWQNYFDLTRDYQKISESCSDYPVAQRAMQLLPGLRVLNQPPWETIVTFIISANNNVSRIRQLIEKLIANFGTDGALPSPGQLAEVSEDELRAHGFGYRAPYLIGTAKLITEGFPINSLQGLSYEEAHRLLLSLPGVGDKVADCIQLFSTGHSEAFPVDVWVERLMKKWFVPDTLSKREIRAKAHEMFGKNAGIVQQSLFHCARLNLIPLE